MADRILIWTLDSIVTLKKYAGQNKTVRDVLKIDEGYIKWIHENVSHIKFSDEVVALIVGGGNIPDTGITAPDIPIDLNISGAGEVRLHGSTLRTMIEAMSAINQCIVAHPIHGSVLVYLTADLIVDPMARILALLIEVETRLKGNRPVSFSLLPEGATSLPTLPSVPDSSNFQGSVDDLPY